MTIQRITVVAVSVTVILLLSVVILPDISEQNLLPFQSEKSKIMEARQGYPDLFFQYHHDIRANEHGVVEYPVGYRTTEFQKALARAKSTGSTLGWAERGPGNVGGRTRAILVDPDDPLSTWWAGSVSGGLWKTTDRGKLLDPRGRRLTDAVRWKPGHGRKRPQYHLHGYRRGL